MPKKYLGEKGTLLTYWLYFHRLLILVLVTAKLLKTEEIAVND